MLYRGYSKRTKKYIPKVVARFVSCINNLSAISKSMNHVSIKTYDGSGQATHPDIVLWRSELWMVCTPYPYACDKYENPCVYHGKTLSSLKPVYPNVPIAKPTGLNYGDYCSDPCLIDINGLLYVFWRDKLKNKDGTTSETLYYCISEDGNVWSEKIISYSNTYRNENEIRLSPAILQCGNKWIMYYVRKCKKTGGKLYITLSDECNNWGASNHINIENMPEDFDLWHIGIVSSKDRTKNLKSMDEELVGLFLLRNNHNSDYYVLYTASGSIATNNWRLDKKVNVHSELGIDVTPYKAAFVPTLPQIVFGAFDSKNRWYLFYCDIESEYW